MYILVALPREQTVTLTMIEGSLTAIAIAACFAWPRIGVDWFSRIERRFGLLARKKGIAVLTVGLAVLFFRLAILPWYPIPLPFVPDDFSFLLGADTFAHGRLTNPTPAMWVHFETIHVDMQPTYMSMYFPGQALLLGAGKVLLGSPWYGVLISSALMCAGLCWMLQAWLPPGWALFGGMIAVLRLGLFSYWMNSYTGGGFIAALGGALVLGALPRLMKSLRFRYGLLMAVGIILLILTRPYEGMLLCLPVAVVLARWVFSPKSRPSRALLVRRAAFPIVLVLATIAWLGYYDSRAFGSPSTLPYTVNRATYAIAPYYVWQHRRAEPVYRHESIRNFYNGAELKGFAKFETFAGFIRASSLKIAEPLLFFGGFVLLPPLFMIRRVFLDRRIRLLVLCVVFLIPGMLIQIFLIPHYLAPFTAVFYAIGLQAMRHLRLWSAESRPVGMALVRVTAPAVPFACSCAAILRAIGSQCSSMAGQQLVLELVWS